MLITFANSLDPDQNRQNVGFDPDPKKSADNKKPAKLASRQRVQYGIWKLVRNTEELEVTWNPWNYTKEPAPTGMIDK